MSKEVAIKSIKTDEIIDIESTKEIRLRVGNSHIILAHDKIVIDSDKILENCSDRHNPNAQQKTTELEMLV